MTPAPPRSDATPASPTAAVPHHAQGRCSSRKASRPKSSWCIGLAAGDHEGGVLDEHTGGAERRQKGGAERGAAGVLEMLDDVDGDHRVEEDVLGHRGHQGSSTAMRGRRDRAGQRGSGRSRAAVRSSSTCVRGSSPRAAQRQGSARPCRRRSRARARPTERAAPGSGQTEALRRGSAPRWRRGRRGLER